MGKSARMPGRDERLETLCVRCGVQEKKAGFWTETALFTKIVVFCAAALTVSVMETIKSMAETVKAMMETIKAVADSGNAAAASLNSVAKSVDDERATVNPETETTGSIAQTGKSDAETVIFVAASARG